MTEGELKLLLYIISFYNQAGCSVSNVDMRVGCALTQSQFALASVIGIVGLSSRGLAQGAQPSRSTAPVVTTGDFANLAFLSVLQGGSVVSRYEPGMSDNITALADRRQRF